LTHARAAVRPCRPSLPAAEEATSRAGLALVLLAALAVRLWVVATHTYVVWPDETFQHLEPAHRLLFGSGVIFWEFLDGIRSWFLPGIVAGVMGLVSLVDPDPRSYVLVLRLLCVLASLSVPFVGFQLAARRFGPVPALLAGLLCALASETVYFAPTIMTEPLATDAALLAIWLGDSAREPPLARRRLLAAGLLFGLASSLRYQYAPVLGLVALLQHARSPRNLAIVAAGGIAVVVPVLGVLDALTLGAPFQSVWLNYTRNVTQGISGAISTEAWFYYAAYYLLAWGVAAPALLAGAALGAVRVPVLAAVVLATFGLHSLTPHKELRFVFLATACMPMLVGVGLGVVLQRMPRLRPAAVGAPVAAALALAISGYTAVATYGHATPLDAWHRGRSVLQATAAARVYPEACGLAIRTIRVYFTGGYTYWHRDLPIYFETWDDAQKLEHSTFRLRLESVLGGRSVPQYPGAALAANAGKFNVMVGARTDSLPGFAESGCYGRGSLDDPAYCVFTRPGGCQ
jgi:4-amino-4-deoxy-L-arabinose transferase-like glycosyltransferase